MSERSAYLGLVILAIIAVLFIVYIKHNVPPSEISHWLTDE